MKKCFLISLTFSLFTFSVLKGAITITPQNQLPLELQLLIISLQQESTTLEKQEELIKKVKELNQIFIKMNPSTIRFIVKTTLYRKILESDLERTSIPFSRESVANLGYRWRQFIHDYHPFASWLIESLQSDLWQLTESTRFPVNAVPSSSLYDKKLEGRIQLLLPWYQAIMKSDPPELHAILDTVMNSILDNLILQGRLYLSLTPPLPADQLTQKSYFEFREQIQESDDVEKNPYKNYRKEKAEELQELLNSFPKPVLDE